MEIPLWWLVVSGLFFAAGIAVNIGLVVALLQARRSLAELEPQVKSLLGKVEHISSRVDAISGQVQATVDSIGGKARHVADNFENVALTSSQSVGKLSGYLAMALAAIRLYKEVRTLMAVDKEKPAKP